MRDGYARTGEIVRERTYRRGAPDRVEERWADGLVLAELVDEDAQLALGRVAAGVLREREGDALLLGEIVREVGLLLCRGVWRSAEPG